MMAATFSHDLGSLQSKSSVSSSLTWRRLGLSRVCFIPRELRCQMAYKISPFPLLMTCLLFQSALLCSPGWKLIRILWQCPLLSSYFTKSSLMQAKTSLDEYHIKKIKFMDTKRQKINLESFWIVSLWMPSRHWLPHLSFAQMNYLCPPCCARVTNQKHFARCGSCE